MELKDILLLENDLDKITELKKRSTDQPDIKTYLKQWDPNEHDIFDTALRPDKNIYSEKVSSINGQPEQQLDRTEKVARVAIAIQKLITKRSVAFLFGLPVKLQTGQLDESQKKVLLAIEKILAENKVNSFNRKAARSLFKSTEVAEYWYTLDSDKQVNHTLATKKKIKCTIFAPDRGDTLFPLFDDYGDLIAFSREVTTKSGDKSIIHFETWTAEKYLHWKNEGASWEVVEQKQNLLGKIPIIYATQDSVEWADVQFLIDRLEKLLSNFADTNDYHASPTIKVRGKVTGFAKKGEAGKIIEMDSDADASYLSWDKAPESVQLEINTLFRLIYTITQTPDISFEAIKGTGALSGVALKLMFSDAHLKVMDKQEIFDEYLQRRINLLKTFIATLSSGLKTACETIEITPEITPFMIDDEKATIEALTLANGNKALVSHLTSIKAAGLATDAQAEYDQIQKEEQEANMNSLSEPTV